MNTHPLNLILYGPPGTGKTYNTVNEALSIIEGKKIEDLQNENRENVLERFNKYKEEGRIVFTTFHQSLSYEEFIEGIKPIPPQNQEQALNIELQHFGKSESTRPFGDGKTIVEGLNLMTYEVKPGIFKQLCNNAGDNNTKVVAYNVTKTETIEISSIKIAELLKEFSKKIDDEKSITVTAKGHQYTILQRNPKSFRVKKDSTQTAQPVTYDTIKRDWELFKKGEIKSANDIEPKRANKTGKHGTSEHHWVVYNALRDFENELLQKEQNIVAQEVETTETITETVPQNYVLIIDEINRGNVSQIFGELITLIEEDKRLGNKEALTVKLPYSGEDFGVPGNLYIIGTMNTADRSVEALDTALRRRFEFKEMMPKPELVKGNIICGYDLKDIITTINNRIRVLKDREHQIGHSYFMKCKTDVDLKNVFKNNIVPLLQEYFYGNYAYIGLVLGNGFVLKDEEANNPKFATFDGKEAFENNTDTQYKLLDEEGWVNLDMTVALQQLIG